MTDRVLPLGDPRLRRRSDAVADPRAPSVRAEVARLKAALEAFRRERGFGRGIAAPQIGVPIQLVAVNLGAGPLALLNPVLTWRSAETFTLWDDCMCFPDLLVRVRRHRSVSVAFLDEEGQPRTWERLPMAESELLQHEVDHLHGVLAVDLALDSRSIIYRTAFDADPAYFRAQVDYVIPPTIGEGAPAG